MFSKKATDYNQITMGIWTLPFIVIITTIIFAVQVKPNRPLFLQSKQGLALQDQKGFNKMLISTWMHEISIVFAYFYK